VTLLLLIGLVMVFWLPSLSPMQTTLAAAALLLLVIATDLWLWQTAYLALPMASVMVLAIVLYGLDMAVGYFLESSAKRRLATLFGQLRAAGTGPGDEPQPGTLRHGRTQRRTDRTVSQTFAVSRRCRRDCRRRRLARLMMNTFRP